jgi:hypothetical protein
MIALEDLIFGLEIEQGGENFDIEGGIAIHFGMLE